MSEKKANTKTMNRLTPILLIALSNLTTGMLFSERPHRSIRQATVDRIFQSSLVSRHRATKDDTETWSKAGRGESRLGVRRRVRAVLKKARERTGVSNDSELLEFESKALEFDSTLGYEVTSPLQLSLDFDSDLLGSDPTLSMAAISTTSFGTSQPKNGVAKNGVSKEPLNGSSNAAEEVGPLPFTLPSLTQKQRDMLLSGERVQEQSKMGGEGSGFVVMDIPAPEYAIWEVLLDFEAYPENIGTVRSMRMFTNTHLKQSYYAETPLPPGAIARHFGKASISRALFVLSKFRLNIAAVHKYVPHPDGHCMVFTLDRATKNAVLQDAKGIWHTQANPEGKEGITRVWLLCELSVSAYFPTFIVDYAAQRAMPRATTWLPGAVKQYLDATSK